MKEELLITYLKAHCTGKRNIQTRAQVARALRLTDNELQRLIHRLRVRGVPIASSRDGCYYAANASEIFSTIQLLVNMVDGLNESIEGLKASMEGFTEGPGNSGGDASG